MLIVMFVYSSARLSSCKVHGYSYHLSIIILNIPPLMLKSLIIFAIFLFSIIGHFKIILF